MALIHLVLEHITYQRGAKMYYYDHNLQLCFDDGKTDWFVNEQTNELVKQADWFWYLRD